MKDSSQEEILLTQWRTCVEMANSVSQRRDTMNNIFISINTAIITTVLVVQNMKARFMLVAGGIVCVWWFWFIRNYKRLNKAKFEVINEIEKNLPCQPFNNEWNKLKAKFKYKDGTNLELLLPITFGCFYLVTAICISLY